MKRILAILTVSLALMSSCISPSQQIGDATNRVQNHLHQARESTGIALFEIREGRSKSNQPEVRDHLDQAEKHSEKSLRHTSGAIADTDRVVSNLTGIQDKPTGTQVILRYLFWIAIIGGIVYLLERLQLFSLIGWGAGFLGRFIGPKCPPPRCEGCPGHEKEDDSRQ